MSTNLLLPIPFFTHDGFHSDGSSEDWGYKLLVRPYIAPVVPIDMLILRLTAKLLMKGSTESTSFTQSVISHPSASNVLVRALDSCHDPEVQEDVTSIIVSFSSDKQNLRGMINEELKQAETSTSARGVQTSLRYLLGIMALITSTKEWKDDVHMTFGTTTHPPLAKTKFKRIFRFPLAGNMYIEFDPRSEFHLSELILIGENGIPLTFNQSTSLPVKPVNIAGSRLQLQYKCLKGKQTWGFAFSVTCDYDYSFDEDGTVKRVTVDALFSSAGTSPILDYCLGTCVTDVLLDLARLLANLMYTPEAKTMEKSLLCALNKLIALSSLEAILPCTRENKEVILEKRVRLQYNTKREIARGLLGALSWLEDKAALKRVVECSLQIVAHIADISTVKICAKLFLQLATSDIAKTGLKLKDVLSDSNVMQILLQAGNSDFNYYGQIITNLFRKSQIGFELSKDVASQTLNISEDGSDGLIFESPHNYPDSADDSFLIHFPKAVGIKIVFDPR